MVELVVREERFEGLERRCNNVKGAPLYIYMCIKVSKNKNMDWGQIQVTKR
jgi:hypothetical protein